MKMIRTMQLPGGASGNIHENNSAKNQINQS